MTQQATDSGTASTEEIVSRAATLISPGHLTDGALERVGAWMRTPGDEPLALRDFLRTDAAVAMSDAMRALPVWVRHVTAYRNLTETEFIDEADWAGHPERAACHFVAQPLTAALESGAMAPGHQRALRQFLSFVVISNRMRDWISLVSGVELDQSHMSIELAAYGRDDQIMPHQDLFPRRVLGGNFYLDQDYRSGTGGRLGYRVDGGPEYLTEPQFNTLSLFRIRPDAHHWVEPFQPETAGAKGRYTVSIGLHRAE